MKFIIRAAILIWALVILGAIVGVLKYGIVHAAEPSMIYRDNDGSVVRLHPSACKGTPEWLAMKAASMHWHGKDYQACWFMLASYVIVMDEAGDVTPMPMVAFTPDAGV